MNIQPPQKRYLRPLTLIDVLIMIAIVCVLTGLLLPARSSRDKGATFSVGRMEIRAIQSAITSYEVAYGQFPSADSNTNEDITYGIDPVSLDGFQKVLGTRLVTNNSDIMMILLDLDQGVNAGHKLNPQRHAFLDVRIVNDTESPGVSEIDHQFRDPWGNPYIISLDANLDGWTRDAFYSSPVVSSKQLDGPLKDNNGAYEAAGGIMVWSRGPDGKADPKIPANTGVNKDNITSWGP